MSFRIGICQCGCGEDIPIRSKGAMLQRFKYNHHTKGSNNINWKGGRPKSRGYVLKLRSNHHFTRGDGYVSEHRIVWEDAHNACLLPRTVVHHKDENPENNVWYNLQAVSKAQHASIHHIEDFSDRRCIECQRCDTRWNIDRRRNRPYPIWLRHPITKREWICKRCYDRIRKARRNNT